MQFKMVLLNFKFESNEKLLWVKTSHKLFIIKVVTNQLILFKLNERNIIRALINKIKKL